MIQMRFKLLTFIVFLTFSNLFGQQSSIDSLKIEIESYKKDDRKKVDLLNELAHFYSKSHTDSIQFYTEKSKSLAEKLNYEIGIADALKIEAIYYYYQGNIDQSFQNLDTAISKYKEKDNLKGLANAYNNYALVLNTYGKYKNSTEKYLLALDINKKRKDTTSIIRNLVNLGNSVSNQTEYKQAQSYFDEAIKLAEAIEDKQQQANIYNGYAILDERTGNFDEAKKNILKAQRIYKELDVPAYLFITYNNLANIERKQSNYDEAIRNFQEALKIAQEIDNKRYQGIVLNNIASCWYNLENYDKALEMYKASAKIAEPIDQRTYMASISNVALIYSNEEDNTEKLKEAIKIYKEAEAYYLEQNTKGDLTNAYNNLASVYFSLKDTVSAKSYFLKAQKLGEEISAKYYLANTYYNLAMIFKSEKKLVKSTDLAKKAYELAIELDLLDETLSSAQLLADIFEKEGEFEKALLYQRKVQDVSDQLSDKEKIKELGKLEAELEFKLIEDEIKLENERKLLEKETKLKRQNILIILFSVIVIALSIIVFLLFKVKKNKEKINKILKTSQDKIEKQNLELKDLHQQKNKLFSIISHDLRGPLKNLKSFFEMRLNSHISDKEFTAMIPEIDRNLEGTIVLTDNLLNWASNLVKNQKITPEDVSVFNIAKKVENLFRTSLEKKGINLVLDLDQETKIYTSGNNLELIIRNLVSNAIKYSHENETIKISCEEQEEDFKICVEDNGSGMPETQKNNLFKGKLESIVGTNKEEGTGIGLLLCKNFIDEINGDIWVEFSEIGKGTVICFTIPKNK